VNVFPGARYFQSPNYGYPTVRAPRRIKPTILAVIHIADSMTSAESQTRWSFSTNSKSWTFMLDRNGEAVQSLDPVTQTAWTNGLVQSPDTSNPLIAAAAGSSYNFNEFCFLTIENVGMPHSDPITPAQEATIRRILAWGSKLSGIPISRKTVIGHYQVDGVSRRNCPVLPAQRDGLFARLVGGLPDTAVEPEDDMREWITKLRPEGYLATLPERTNVRLAPELRSDTLAETLPRALEITVNGRVWGDEFPAGSDNHWWLSFCHPEKGLLVVHSSQITNRRGLAGDLEADLAAAKAKVEKVKEAAVSALLIVSSIAKNRADKVKEL
jgi:hypothetical protein